MRIRRAILQYIQNTICSVVLLVLARTLEVLPSFDERAQCELGQLPEGFVYTILIAGKYGAKLTMTIKEGKLNRTKIVQASASGVTITFKSVNAAFRVFTGQTGVAQAYVQHRFILSGDIALAMPLVRLIDIAEGYLFPSIITRRFLRALVQRRISHMGAYARVLIRR